MKRFDRLERLRTRVADTETALDRVESRFSLLSNEWSEMQGRLTKAFQRVERANQRAEKGNPPPEPSETVEESADPYARKLALIRSQGGAVPSRSNESAG